MKNYGMSHRTPIQIFTLQKNIQSFIDKLYMPFPFDWSIVSKQKDIGMVPVYREKKSTKKFIIIFIFCYIHTASMWYSMHIYRDLYCYFSDLCDHKIKSTRFIFRFLKFLACSVVLFVFFSTLLRFMCYFYRDFIMIYCAQMSDIIQDLSIFIH